MTEQLKGFLRTQMDDSLLSEEHRALVGGFYDQVVAFEEGLVPTQGLEQTSVDPLEKPKRLGQKIREEIMVGIPDETPLRQIGRYWHPERNADSYQAWKRFWETLSPAERGMVSLAFNAIQRSKAYDRDNLPYYEFNTVGDVRNSSLATFRERHVGDKSIAFLKEAFKRSDPNDIIEE